MTHIVVDANGGIIVCKDCPCDSSSGSSSGSLSGSSSGSSSASGTSGGPGPFPGDAFYCCSVWVKEDADFFLLDSHCVRIATQAAYDAYQFGTVRAGTDFDGTAWAQLYYTTAGIDHATEALCIVAGCP
jgi:hypothetical protein